MQYYSYGSVLAECSNATEELLLELDDHRQLNVRLKESAFQGQKRQRHGQLMMFPKSDFVAFFLLK